MSLHTDLLVALRAAPDFTGCVRAALSTLLALVDAALHAGDWADARLLRAMVHLRDAGGYVGAWVLEAGADRLSPAGRGEALLPSATAWRRVAAGGRAAVVDVALRTVTGADGRAEAVRWAERRPEPLPEVSQVRLSSREATHAAVLPLPGLGGVRGLLSVEVRCRRAIGTPFVWPACLDALEVAGALAGPWLLDRFERRAAVSDPPRPDATLPVIGATMAPIVRLAEVFAAEDETLLLCGETGTGKSRLARWCHARSSRHRGPFEVLDLLGVPAETQAGELFGWRKGAFTGAVGDHDGAVRRAEGGTLFIDEVDKLSLDAQAMLLRLLEEKTWRPLGGAGAARRADVRFIVGTNVDLGAAVAAGGFRSDLLYRIDVLPIALPPLRRRTDEVADWARYMLDRMAAEADRAPPTLTEDAARALEARPWPGNLRQLDNVLRRASALARMDGSPTLDAAHLRRAEGLSPGSAPTAPLAALDDGFGALLAAAADADPAALAAVDWPGALHGLLLARAVRLAGDREGAFARLGRGDVVEHRNHHRTLKREWSKALALLDALGVAPADRAPPDGAGAG